MTGRGSAWGWAEILSHLWNVIVAAVVLSTGGGVDIPLTFLRELYVGSLIAGACLFWYKRGNALFLARSFFLLLPGYFAAGVQLVDPALYYSAYEHVSQTLDISMTMFALSNLALLGSDIGFKLAGSGSRKSGDGRFFSSDFCFYAAVVPLILVSYYVSLTYGETLFSATYATTSWEGGIGSANAVGGILAFLMFQNYLEKRTPVKAAVFLGCMFLFLVYAMLIRGGRQDVVSCLFGLYVVYWAQQRKPAPISRNMVIIGLVGAVFIEYIGYIRGSVLSTRFDYVGAFKEFVRYYLHPDETVNFGTVSPIASTFGNTIYALKTGIAGHINGRGYWEYILRTPPEFMYPDRPKDFAWIMVDWNLKAGGGFFELAEAYFNFGVIGAFLAPMAVSYAVGRAFYGYARDKGVFSGFLLFGFLSIFLRGAMYQTFAFYRAATVSIVIMLGLTLIYRLISKKRGADLSAYLRIARLAAEAKGGADES